MSAAARSTASAVVASSRSIFRRSVTTGAAAVSAANFSPPCHQQRDRVAGAAAFAAVGRGNLSQSRHQRRWYSSYEYPQRTEAPVVSRTLASAAMAAAVDEPVQATPSGGQPDRFDDSQTLSPNERHHILQAQKMHIPTTLDPSHRILPEVPASIPPNVPVSMLTVPETLVTTLPNGVRVASQETYGQVCTVGLLADCGSRHETSGSTGVNHLLELLAFQSTETRSAGDISALMDELGGATFATGSREQMMYCVDVLRPNVEAALEVLAETVLRPRITEEEVAEMKKVIEYQHLDMLPEVKLGEGLQVAAYGPLGGDGEVQQLGRPHFCPLEALPNLTAQTVHDFRRDNLLIPQEMVVAGAGIGHEQLVSLAERYLSDIPVENPNQPPPADRTVPSTYTGGEFKLETKTVDGFTRVALAFEVGGWHSDDLVPTCVLQTLLGGGNSFSAGGPGKGMYSRLYREVLNMYHWAESAEAFTSFHAESGLLGISGSSVPAKSGDVTRVLSDHFGKLSSVPVTDEELERARNMLKCNVLTQLESRLVLFEDIGRQILTYGKREETQSMCKKIDEVTKEDIMEIAQRATSTAPTLASVGDDVKKVPSHDELKSWFGSR